MRRGLLAAAVLACAATASARLDLAPMLEPDRPLWSLRREDLSRSVLAPGRFRAGNPSRSTHVRLGDLPIAEALLIWDEDGTLAAVRLVAVSRGDVPDLTIEDQDRIRAACERIAAAWAGGREREEEEERLQAAVTNRRRWTLDDRVVTLTWGTTRRHFRRITGARVEPRAEYVRLDIRPRAPEVRAEIAVPPARPPTDTAPDPWAARVEQRPNGDVQIVGVPMVDQGERGYCVAATIARLQLYFGMEADTHEVAQWVNASPTAGTNPVEMMDALQRFGTRLGLSTRRHLALDPPSLERLVQQYNRKARRSGKPAVELGRVVRVGAVFAAMDSELLIESRGQQRREFERFLGLVRRYVDEGMPLAWTLVLGKVPESGRTPQTAGGHMRLIIGYNDRTRELIFSDSWGAGHEAKRIAMDHAWAVTVGLYTIEPR